MKKFLAFALAAIAGQMQAVSLDWGLGADVYLLEEGKSYTESVLATESSAPAVASGSYLALVYIGQNASSFDIGSIDASRVVDRMPYAIDDSAGYADYDPIQKSFAVTEAAGFSDGASFGVVWYDAKSGKFHNIISIDDGSALNDVVTVSDIVRGTPDPITPALFTNGYGGVLTVSVPEPGIACMALLGIGMMIKRRRA